MEHGSEEDPIVVLVVEDEPLARMFAADILIDDGYKVLEAVNADQAMALLNARSDVHAVVTDIEMPGSMNGLVLATTIMARWPGIAVLVNSGRLKPEGAIPQGVGFVGKPYQPNALLDLLKELLQIKSQDADIR